MSSPPSGLQHEIRFESQRAVICEVGATLRVYRVGDIDVLDGFSEEELSTDGRGQVLCPWPNRLDAGAYTFEGRQAQAALDEPVAGNAIHGLVRWLPWTATSESEHHVALSCELFPQPGYPWHVQLSVGYELGNGGLIVETTAIVLSDSPAPFGIGFHPYFALGGARVDDTSLTIPARHVLVSNDRGLPVGEAAVDQSSLDFASPRTIGPTVLDSCFTDLVRGDDGRARATLQRDEGTVTVWLGPGFRYLMAFTGDSLDVGRRRRSVALEPMTCPPNALRSGTDLIRLEAGAPAWKESWGIEVDVA